ncbi:hypothetical protein BDF20DRAFT_880774 [Mycotypha africana]|uniref:uncharacterized protein n=1 Tax=Mycotypha africana TaxID=64632 RepID=UPI0023001EC2|nr:uncharacterized protein BDF20DRAFT_880774 [Mycotypha africana]KAI8975791.1 hypothetical protein BDF20DRAFT_880774 [Mycotypha africana]
MTKKLLYIEFFCHICEKGGFTKKQHLNRHYCIVERMPLSPSLRGRPYYNIPIDCTITTDQKNAHVIKYACPCCHVLSEDKANLARHVETHRFKQKADAFIEEGTEDYYIDESDKDSDPELNDYVDFNNMAASADDDSDVKPEESIPSDNRASVVEPILSSELPATITPLVGTNRENRTEQQAILHACQKQAHEENERNKTIFIVDTLSLRPFAILDQKGNEENALAHEDVIKRLASNHSSVQPIVPMKRSYQQENSSIDSTLCAKCILKTHIDLEKLLATSPYGLLLSQRKYKLLTDEMCEMMNQDWRHNAQVKYFTAAILAGSILLNTRKSEAIMINTVELYGRTKIVDGHREPFGNQKDGVHTTSLPPPLKTVHLDVWPVCLSRNDGPKLVIGTQVSNALITSSIRLDKNLPPSVGGITTNFHLTFSDSFASKIFVDVESATAAKTIISDPTRTCVSNTGILSHQLRQIRTRFDMSSTYTLARASGPLTKNHTCHPYTIFTLIDCDRGRSPCAALFDAVANEVLKNGNKANLMKHVVLSCYETATGQVKEVLESILTLYNQDDKLPILFNIVLNKKLEILANLLMPSIVSCNASVARQIKSAFEYLN